MRRHHGFTTWAFPTLLVLGAFPLSAADWPMWRCTANRSATITQALAGTLHLQWVREYPQLTPAWPDQLAQGWPGDGLLYFDVAYSPVVVGNTMIVGSSHANRVTGIDVVTGAESWRHHTGGPVRFAPACTANRAYVACDDGYLYCLEVSTGALVWKFQAAPRRRVLLGNGRLTSAWPVRGAPVIDTYERSPGVFADAVYFSAGIFPFEGVFIYAIDAETGAVIWVNDGTGATWMNQPHNTPSFAGPGPQGYLVSISDKLIVPGGRSVPAGLDRGTGEMLYYNLADYGKRGLFLVTALGSEFYNGGEAYDIGTGLETSSSVPDPYGTAVRIRADGVIYRIGSTGVVKNDIGWSSAVLPSTVREILAGADRLFAVTEDGRIYCWGPTSTTPVTHAYTTTPAPASDQYTTTAAQVLSASGKTDGVCVALGIGTGRLIEEIARQSNLYVVAFDPDSATVETVRARLDSAGLYGNRISVNTGSILDLEISPYMADLIVSEDIQSAGVASGATFVSRVFDVLRPYGGVAYLPVTNHTQLEGWLAQARCPYAELTQAVGHSVLSRPHGPAGADNWTHQYHDEGNDVVSKDELVKAPLGILWFGGPTHFDVLPRHGHGPSPHVVDGRLFIEGPNMIRAVDVYTGRLLWQKTISSVGQRYNNTSHEAGANGIGSNFVSVSGSVYVLSGTNCLRLDPATGDELGRLSLPSGPAGSSPKWGYIVVSGDYLIAGAGPLQYDAGDIGTSASQNGVASTELVVMDRISGTVLWRTEADNAFRHNTITAGNGKVFCIDGQPYNESGSRIDFLGLLKSAAPVEILPATLVAFDLASGDTAWSTGTDVYGTWTGYSAEHDVLLQGTRDSRDMLNAEPSNGRVIAYRGQSGVVLWDKSFGYGGPLMINDQTLLLHDGYNGRDLLTGDALVLTEALASGGRPLRYTRSYGCNTNIASRNLVTFRSGAAGYYDLKRTGGTGNFGGFKSSCTSNLIPAAGLLNAPDYTRTCVCRYQNQTSLALVHMPRVEEWTFDNYSMPSGRVQRMGINFGAPGDRREDNGVLWLEYPEAGSPSPEPGVTVSPSTPDSYRHHSARVTEGPLPWVAASGLRGMSSVVVPLNASSASTYVVRLYFLEPEALAVGQRVFDLSIQGQSALSSFDIVEQAGGPWRSVMREFRNVTVSSDLTVSFTAHAGQPLISGICVVDQAAYGDSLDAVPTAMISPIIGSVFAEGETYWLKGEGRNLTWTYDADDDGAGTVSIDTGAVVPFVAPSGVSAPMTLTLTLQGTDGTVSRTFRIESQAVSVSHAPVTAVAGAPASRAIATMGWQRPPAPTAQQPADDGAEAPKGPLYAARTAITQADRPPSASTQEVASDVVSYDEWVDDDDNSGAAERTAADYRPADMDWHCKGPCVQPVAVTASSADGIHAADNTLDGDLRSRWSAEGAGPQWLVYDLGSTHTVTSVTVVWYSRSFQSAHAAFETSLDGTDYTRIDSGVLRGSGTNTTLRTFLPQEARYIRVSLTGEDGAAVPSVYETGIHGRAVVLAGN